MSKDELIVKQQIEIEELRQQIKYNKEAAGDALNHLYRPEQWSIRCPDFPKVAMKGIVMARDAIEGI
jgi:uncharacterized protein (DUF952 family)